MDLGVIAIRYARALLKGAMARYVETDVYQDMQTLSQSYLQVSQLRFTIANPMLANERKLKLIETAAGGNPSELTRRFVRLVFDEGRQD